MKSTQKMMIMIMVMVMMMSMSMLMGMEHVQARRFLGSHTDVHLMDGHYKHFIQGKHFIGVIHV